MKTYDVIDPEYNNRVKMAEATNLKPVEPEKYYFPASMFNEIYSFLLDLTVDDEEQREEILEKVDEYNREYKNRIVSLNFIDVQEAEKAEVDICPYCGTKMRLISGGQGTYRRIGTDYVWYECPVCGSTTPRAYFNNHMLDEQKVKDAIEDIIVSSSEVENNECEDY